MPRRESSTARRSAASSVARPLYGVSVFLVAYGSLYPFEFVRPASDAEAWRVFITNLSLWTSAGDVVGNVLLCIPLGLFAGGVVGPARHRRALLAAVFGFNVAWVFALQVAQIYFPPRDASLSDAFWNTVGILLGMGIAVPFERIAQRPGRIWRTDALVPVCLVVAWLATQLAPFVPSLDWQLMKDALKPLLRDPQIEPVALVFSAARVLAAGILLDAILLPGQPRVRRFALLLGAVLGAKLLIVNQRLTPNNVLGFSAGFAAWCALAKAGRGRSNGVALALLFIAYTLESVLPFQFRASPEPMHLLPFEALLEGAMEVNAWSLVEAGFVFGTMLWMSMRSGGSVTGVSIALAAWVGLMEWAQRWIVGRTSDITMPMLVLAIGFVLRRLHVAQAGPWNDPAAMRLAGQRPPH